MSCSKISIIEIPISLRFKISKEKLLHENQKEEWWIESRKFSIQELPGVTYNVGIYYNKSEGRECFSNKRLFVFMGLHNEAKLNNINVDYKISIPTADYTGTNMESTIDHDHFYYSSVEPADELFDPTKNFIVNDMLVITMEAILRVQEEDFCDTVSDAKEPKCCECKLGLLLWERDDKDFTFIAEEKEIKVHKLIICAKSPVFDRMIQSGLKETTECKVSITDFDGDTVEIALKFCYGIKEQHLWNVEIATQLLLFSDKYDISDLKTLAEIFLFSKIDPLNVCKVANASIILNFIELRQQCFEYLFGCNHNKIFVTDLDLLDKDFAVELMKASFSHSAM